MGPPTGLFDVGGQRLVTPPIRGRAGELVVIGGLVSAVAGGRGGALVIEGPPGIGKSRLLTEVLTLAEVAGVPQTVPTRCSRGRMLGARRSVACNRTVTTSDGVSLSVRDWGSHAAGHTVVLLHGFCLNKESWNIQMTQLIGRWGNNIRIIGYDHRGHGNSGNASMHTYRIDQLADDLAELLVALGVTGPLTLAGHSMDGMTALAYLRRPASKRPVEPECLLLVATAAGNLGSHGLGRLLSTPATSMLYHLVHRMPRAGTDEVDQFLARPVCAALTRLACQRKEASYCEYGPGLRKGAACV
jgi:hypothetical protein